MALVLSMITKIFGKIAVKNGKSLNSIFQITELITKRKAA